MVVLSSLKILVVILSHMIIKTKYPFPFGLRHYADLAKFATIAIIRIVVGILVYKNGDY